MKHANIVQRVKICYKIKIDSRVPDCCFWLCSAVKKYIRYCMIKVALLECKSGAIAALCACLAQSFITHFSS